MGLICVVSAIISISYYYTVLKVISEIWKHRKHRKYKQSDDQTSCKRARLTQLLDLEVKLKVDAPKMSVIISKKMK